MGSRSRDEQCPVCDRPECRRSSTWSAYTSYCGGPDGLSAASLDVADAELECSAKAVDWRSRALASAARVAELEALLGEARAFLDHPHCHCHGEDSTELVTRIDAALAVAK